MGRQSKTTKSTTTASSRRAFIKRSSLLLAGSAVGAPLGAAPAVHAFGSDTVRVGLIGCGRRGVQAVIEALNTPQLLDGSARGEVCLTTMADRFGNRLHAAYRAIKGRHPRQSVVRREHRFIGPDAYRQLLETDVDVVLVATPAYFHPILLAATVAAGKHAYIEMPIAVDVPGIDQVMSANQTAKKSGLVVAVGLPHRHEERYIETIRRIHAGAIGNVQLARTYCNTPGPRPNSTSHPKELENQIRNWTQFLWLGGGPLRGKSVHQIDVINWVLRSGPAESRSLGASDRTCDSSSDAFLDQQAVEYTYPGGAKLFTQVRQRPNCWNCVAEFIRGTAGSADLTGGKLYDSQDNLIWRFGPGAGNGLQHAQKHLFATLRTGGQLNELDHALLCTRAWLDGNLG